MLNVYYYNYIFSNYIFVKKRLTDTNPPSPFPQQFICPPTPLNYANFKGFKLFLIFFIFLLLFYQKYVILLIVGYNDDIDVKLSIANSKATVPHGGQVETAKS